MILPGFTSTLTVGKASTDPTLYGRSAGWAFGHAPISMALVAACTNNLMPTWEENHRNLLFQAHGTFLLPLYRIDHKTWTAHEVCDAQRLVSARHFTYLLCQILDTGLQPFLVIARFQQQMARLCSS